MTLRDQKSTPKSEKFGSAYLVDSLCDRAEILKDGRSM